METFAFSAAKAAQWSRSEEHTSELQSQSNLVCRLLLEKKKNPTAQPEHAAVYNIWKVSISETDKNLSAQARNLYAQERLELVDASLASLDEHDLTLAQL